MVAAILLPIIISLVSTKDGLQNSLKFEWTLQINPLEILSKLFLGSFDNDSWPEVQTCQTFMWQASGF